MGFFDFMGNGGLIIALVLLGIAVAAVLVFFIINLVSDFEDSKKGLMGAAGLIVLSLIGYALAGNSLPQFAIDANITALQYRLLGAFINIAILATLVACVYILIDIILGFIRN